MLNRFILVFCFNSFSEALIIGVYYNIVEKGYFNAYFICLTLFHLFFGFLRRYKILEKLISKILKRFNFENNFIENFLENFDQVFYIDRINEISAITAEFVGILILFISIKMNFIYFLSFSELSDCKGTPNPHYFKGNFSSNFVIVTLTIKISISLIFTEIIFPKFFKSERLFIPQTNKKFTLILLFYSFLIQQGYFGLFCGIITGKIEELN